MCARASFVFYIYFLQILTVILHGFSKALIPVFSVTASVALSITRQRPSETVNMGLREKLCPIQSSASTNNGTSNSLTVFLHFHKAGGSSIVRAAQSTHTMFNPNNNGNPKDVAKNTIPIWTYPQEKLVQFISYCIRAEITFIAMENRWFNNERTNYLYSRRCVELVTQLRDPFTRFLSNYLFAVKFHEIRQSNTMKNMSLIERLREYNLCITLENNKRHWKRRCKLKGHNCCVTSKGDGYAVSNQYNMYTRILSGNFNRNYTLTIRDLEVAKRELDQFDLVTVMEMPGTAELWKAKYGMEIGHVNQHKRYNETYDLERQRDPDFDSKFKEFEYEFQDLNQMDYALYEYALELHRGFAVQYNISVR